MGAVDDILEALTEDAPVREVYVCALLTAVVLDSQPLRCGLASNPGPDSHPEEAPLRESGLLLRYSGRELAQLLRSPRPLEASVGMAAVNALLNADEGRCLEVNARQLIMERGQGKNIAIVGHFPFVREVRDVAARCWVLEKRPQPGDLPADQADQVLPEADVVAITGMTLLNGTFDGLIKACRPDAFVIVLGPSAPLTPVLFDYGVDVISGARVVDVPTALRFVTQGATFRHVKGVKRVVLEQTKHPR